MELIDRKNTMQCEIIFEGKRLRGGKIYNSKRSAVNDLRAIATKLGRPLKDIGLEVREVLVMSRDESLSLCEKASSDGLAERYQ
jgi:hypothetical protein